MLFFFDFSSVILHDHDNRNYLMSGHTGHTSTYTTMEWLKIPYPCHICNSRFVVLHDDDNEMPDTH